MSLAKQQKYAGEEKREVTINTKHAKHKMNPDHHFQSTPLSTSSFNFPYDHHPRCVNDDSHRRSQYTHHRYAKTDFVKNNESKEEEAGNTIGASKPIGPSSSFVIATSSCPSFSSSSAYSSPSRDNMTKTCERHQSKESQTLPSMSSSEIDEFYAKNIGMASTLVVSYLIEVAVQVFLTVQCYRSFQHQLSLAVNTADVASSSSWFWFLVLSSVLSSCLVTMISIIWVARGMDFAGRLCGRLLCYVMHFFLLGLLWRYLKLAFAYDRADLEEFYKLKTFQTYAQSLPLVTIHLAWILTTKQLLPLVDSYHTLSSWLVVVEMLIAVISFLVLSSSASSSYNYNHNKNKNLQGATAVASPSSAYTEDKCNVSNQRGRCNSDTLKPESSTGDNNPNHHFNDSGTASSVNNHGAAKDEIDTDEKNSCPSVTSSKRLMTIAIKCTMSHYSQKCEPGRALLLVSRVISLGMLVYKMNYYWTGFIILLHLGVSVIWLGCWATISSGKSIGSNIKTALGSSSTTAAFREVNVSNDTCDTSSNDSSSNDSGLVVRSETLMENGIPVVTIPGEEGDIITGTDGKGHNNMDYGVNSCTRGSHTRNGCQITKGDHVNLHNSLSGGLSACLSIVVHQRNSAGNDNSKKLSTNNGLIQREKTQRQVLMRVLPLTYVLFWDLSNSPSAYHLSSSNPINQNRLNSWATAFPLFLTVMENVFITIDHHFWPTVPNIRILTVSSTICMLMGWFLVATYQFRWRSIQRQKYRKRLSNNNQVENTNKDDDEDEVDSGYENRGTRETGSSSDASVKNISKKEKRECLSFCCSSLSHPLNIKRKGRRDPQHQLEAHTFCKDSRNDKPSSAEHHLSGDVTVVRYNEYQEQQELGKLISTQNRQTYDVNHIKSNDDGYCQSGGSRTNSTIKSKRATKKASIFSDLGISNDHTGVNIRENGFEDSNDNDNYKICSRPESMMKYRDDVKMTMACGTTTPVSTPVTINNYTNIKEALTRRISNKSCTNSSQKKSNHQSDIRTSQDRESVKGDGDVGKEEGEARVAISSFKSSSSPSTQLHQQQHQPTPTNSNKCMPISIKSPISWLPETCCNDSNGSGGSSNSRNTNTLVIPEPATANGNRLFYCSENYIDLGNNTSKEDTEESKRASTKQQQQQQRQHFHSQTTDNEGNCDFSVAFFEGRSGGGTNRSYKQKQSRTSVVSNSALLRAARSANTTPVASSKPFPLEIGETTSVSSVQQQNHTHFLPPHHHHQYGEYNDHDDELDPIEQSTKGKGATHPQIRNQITGKTYLSDGASLTSLDGLCEIRASTPVEIKKASRVIVNYPPPHHQISDSKTVSRCLCKVGSSPTLGEARDNRKQCGLPSILFSGCEDNDHSPVRAGGNSNNNNIYEKLIDDSYGILICEGENALGKNSLNRKNCNNRSGSKCKDSCNDPHLYHHQISKLSEAAESRRTAGSGCQKLKILCAKCLENHDPLLTNCVDQFNMVDDDHVPEVVGHYNGSMNINNIAVTQNWQSQHKQHQTECLPQVVSRFPSKATPAESDTTDYPSDTEFTTNNNPMEDDGQSLSTHFSSATYTWHNQKHNNNYHYHHNHNQPKPTQLSQFIWAASSMLPTLGGCNDEGDCSQQQCPKEFTGLEYVRTWLMASHPCTFSTNSISYNNNNNNNSNIHQHPLECHQQHHEIWRKGKNSNSSLRRYAAHQKHFQGRNGKEMSAISSATSKNNHIPLKHKSACDKTISKKKRFRQLEKRQRPIGRGASPPVKELTTSNNNTNGNVDVLNSINATATDVPATKNDATSKDCGVDTSLSTRFQPPPSRKQHPLLLYDMIPRQEQQKPLTATSHKKCRDQLDLFHKELETVV